ncbi:protein-L-isoaspartate(D-aspartate) O-methyltransferase [Natranaerofaba carboxydovora]|uniref:protein-L-isoaspartate(D-aspartate) O-methyltransferase n=1 Tax=Natranaerofaba carboxydovora TaxID=2742683 RepID=UPI001F138016|nr:protein-L-isoaspartate(D-aspartate) O-methyltransferase [Natranaerofaba carboxydovora]UMZ74876.1 Protein-L-isoaspartate O-methyltransferase [Natranaerofaba carboxydovora]
MSVFEKERKSMVKKQIYKRGIREEKVLKAFESVPREKFVPEDQKHMAYGDHPLPIGDNQTISQPYIVALMTDALELQKEDKVLELGTGSGYQAAILGEIASEIFSIERIENLASNAKKILRELGYNNIHIKVDDGTLGWEDKSPFDAIMVTAASPNIPDSLTEQLKTGGRMVIPVGDLHSQDLLKVTKTKSGIEKVNLGGCRFVPLKGEKGWS